MALGVAPRKCFAGVTCGIGVELLERRPLGSGRSARDPWFGIEGLLGRCRADRVVCPSGPGLGRALLEEEAKPEEQPIKSEVGSVLR